MLYNICYIYVFTYLACPFTLDMSQHICGQNNYWLLHTLFSVLKFIYLSLYTYMYIRMALYQLCVGCASTWISLVQNQWLFLATCPTFCCIFLLANVQSSVYEHAPHWIAMWVEPICWKSIYLCWLNDQPIIMWESTEHQCDTRHSI